MTFVLLRYGHSPRTALEDTDTNKNRLAKIVDLISNTEMSVHDLSRMRAARKSEYSRMNMPFELGIDYGIKLALGTGKPIVVLEEEKYSFQKGLSDYSGFDILCHRGKPEVLVKVLRDWFVNARLVSDFTGATAIWYEFTDCWFYIYLTLKERGFSDKETTEIPFNEFVDLAVSWLASRRTA